MTPEQVLFVAGPATWKVLGETDQGRINEIVDQNGGCCTDYTKVDLQNINMAEIRFLIVYASSILSKTNDDKRLQTTRRKNLGLVEAMGLVFLMDAVFIVTCGSQKCA